MFPLKKIRENILCFETVKKKSKNYNQHEIILKI